MEVVLSPAIFSVPSRYEEASNEALGAFVRLVAYAAKFTPEKSEVPASTMRVVCGGRPSDKTLRAMVDAGLVVVHGDTLELQGRGEFWEIKNVSHGAARRAGLAEQALARDGGVCCYCGGVGDLTIDHVVPTSRGGRHRIENIATCCRSCNASKGNRTPDEWRQGVSAPRGVGR